MNLNDPLIYAPASIVAASLLLLFTVARLRRRAESIKEEEKASRLEKFQEAIAEDAKARAAEKELLRSQLLQMSEEAFKRYQKQRGYTYQHYLDVAFNKDDDPEHLFLYEIEERRKLHHFLALKEELSDESIHQVSDETLQEIERKYPYGITFRLKKEPTDIDILKNEIGEAAAAELRRRGVLQ